MKRARSIQVVGIVDIVLGGLGLAASGLITVGCGIVLWNVYRARATAPEVEVHVASGASLSITPSIIVLGLFFLVAAFAEAWLLATGIRLLRRSRHARRSAGVHARTMLPLGILCALIAPNSSDGWPFLAVVVSLTLYAVAQAVAFIALPSWRELDPRPEANAPATT